MSEELKPCPFCGGEAHIQTFHFRYRVGCGNSMAVPVMRWIGERIELAERGA